MPVLNAGSICRCSFYNYMFYDRTAARGDGPCCRKSGAPAGTRRHIRKCRKAADRSGGTRQNEAPEHSRSKCRNAGIIC